MSQSGKRRLDDYLDKGLPHSLDAERSVLGAILLEGTLYNDAAAVLASTDFSLDSHQRVFGSMALLYESGSPIDLVTLSNLLAGRKELESVGGVTYLSTLTEFLPRRDNIDHYIQIVRDCRLRREVIHACNSLLASAFDEMTTPTTELVDMAESKLLEISAGFGEGKIHQGWLKDDGRKAVAQVLAPVEPNETTNIAIGAPTGIDKLDTLTTGYRKREYAIIAAYTGDGKTAFAMQGAITSAQRGLKVGFFSQEMERDQLSLRVVSYFTGIDLMKLRDRRNLNGQERALVENARARFDELPIYIDDTPSLNIDQLISRARIMARKMSISTVFVDYLQIIRVPKAKDKLERVNTVSEQLRLLGKAEDISVIALSQLSRPQGRKKERPTLFMLKESGQIEQDANLVVMPYRPEEEDEAGNYTGQDEIIIAKQRSGPVGSVPVRFNRQSLSYIERKIS